MFYMEVTVSTKYQIVIPKEVRKRLGLKPGQKVRISNVDDTQLTITKPLTTQEFLDKYAGIMRDTPWQKAGVDAADWIRKERDEEWR